MLTLSCAAAPLARPTRPGAEVPGLHRPVPVPAPAAEAPVAPAKRPLASRRRANEAVSLADFAQRHHLTLVWIEAGKRLQLKGDGLLVDLEIGSREFAIDGLRVFLGEAVRAPQGIPQISRIDAERFVAPILRPAVSAGPAPVLRTIVLDAGHGGRDTGKDNASQKVQEKTLTLDTVRRLKPLLEAQGYRVVLTRNDDRYLDLTERAEIAERAGADLFLSVHYNSVEVGAERVTGAEVFTMTPQDQLSTDQKPDRQASLANPGNLYDTWNSVLGFSLHQSLVNNLRVADRGLKHGRLAVLRLATCPAALVEAGYLSHPDETRRLATLEYRQKIAEALADGIKAYAQALAATQAKR